MAFPVNQTPKVEKINKLRSFFEAIRLGNRLKTASETLSRLLNRLELFILSFMYLVFTGIAICLNRKIPKQWFKILPKTRIAKIFESLPENKEETKKETPKSKVRVVDVETGKELNLK